MIIYEVNLEVEKDLEKKFYNWLIGHIKEVVEKGNFISAKIYKVQSEQLIWSVHYLAKDQKHLDHYLNVHAPSLRKEPLGVFGDKFRVSRRILELT